MLFKDEGEDDDDEDYDYDNMKLYLGLFCLLDKVKFDDQKRVGIIIHTMQTYIYFIMCRLLFWYM